MTELEIRTAPVLRWGRSVWGSIFDPAKPAAYFEKLAAADYDFVEIVCPQSMEQAAFWKKAATNAGIGFVAQLQSVGTTSAEHAESLVEQLERASWLEPELVNSHSGRDHFGLQENLTILSQAQERAVALGLSLVHETHRSRATFSAPSTHAVLNALPALRLCADLSHWCCVHESFLKDQTAAVEQAFDRADYLHLRVGHTQSPQIPDIHPPEWQEAISIHLDWWTRKIATLEPGDTLRLAPEFGPFPYRHAPGSAEDLWKVNETMRRLLLARLDS